MRAHFVISKIHNTVYKFTILIRRIILRYGKKAKDTSAI